MDPQCPDGWKLVSLRDLGEVNRGRSRHRPRYAVHLYGGPYPFIQTGDVKASNGRITSYTQTYSEAGLSQSRLWPAETMCITIAANIAETGILTFPACFPDSVVGFVAQPEKADVEFVEYMFRFLRSGIQRQATGSVQDNINIKTLERLRFPIPPLVEQQAIAAVLGSLDDKIELNRRMNATLEQMAQALFQSWFVDFDPVRAKLDGHAPVMLDSTTAALFPASFHKTEIGLIPHGWVAGSFGSITETERERIGGTNASVLSAVASSKLVRSDDHFNKRVYSKSIGNYLKVSRYDFAYNPSRINIGSIGMLKEDIVGAVSPVYEVFRPEPGYHWFVERALAQPETRAWIQTLCSGSVRQSLKLKDLQSIPLVIPPPQVVEAFNSTWEQWSKLIQANENAIRTLSDLRDTLLPKLLSGELSVGIAKPMTARTCSAAVATELAS